MYLVSYYVSCSYCLRCVLKISGEYVLSFFSPFSKGGETTYYASNCYEVGGGNMGPLYLKCAGCQYVEVYGMSVERDNRGVTL